MDVADEMADRALGDGEVHDGKHHLEWNPPSAERGQEWVGLRTSERAVHLLAGDQSVDNRSRGISMERNKREVDPSVAVARLCVAVFAISVHFAHAAWKGQRVRGSCGFAHVRKRQPCEPPPSEPLEERRERIATSADRFVFEVRQLGADADDALAAIDAAWKRADAALEGGG